MTDRDRLIHRIMSLNKPTISLQTAMDIVEVIIDMGVIFPPVEVGDTVWYVDDFTEEIEECKVYGFNVVNGKLSLLVDNGECKFITRKWHNTKEEAKQKLKEVKDNANR